MDALVKIFTTLGLEHYAIVALALSLFIDINPKLKWNPIKAILGYIGKCFNQQIEKEISGFKQEVNDKFDKIQADQKAQREVLDKLVAEQENDTVSCIKWEVIEFENSILNGVKHTRDQYRHILDRSKKYERLVKSKNVKISAEDIEKIRESTELIQKHYDKNRLNQSAMMF